MHIHNNSLLHLCLINLLSLSLSLSEYMHRKPTVHLLCANEICAKHTNTTNSKQACRLSMTVGCMNTD